MVILLATTRALSYHQQNEKLVFHNSALVNFIFPANFSLDGSLFSLLQFSDRLIITEICVIGD